MLAACKDTNAWQDLDRITVHKLHPAGAAQVTKHPGIQRVDRATARSAGAVNVVLVFRALDPDSCIREEIRPVEMIPVDVRDNDVGDLLGTDA